MKSKEELNTLKEEVESLNNKLAELTEEELERVAGGDTGETRNCPYGKLYADNGCNFINFDSRCSYTKAWEECPYPYSIYICLKGCGRFDDRELDLR